MDELGDMKARKRLHETNPLETALLVTASYDHQIKLWTAHDAVCFKTLQYQESQVNHMDISSKKKYLAVAVHQQMRLYDMACNSLTSAFNLEGLSKNVTQVQFMADCNFLIHSGEDGKMKLWDIRLRSSSADRIFSCPSPINAFSLHPNQEKIFIVDQDGSMHVWDLKSDRKVTLPEKQGCSVLNICLNPEATSLATVNTKGECYIWRLQSSGDTGVTLSSKFEAHTKYALKCQFSPDSTLLATTSADGTARLWRTSGNTRLQQLTHPNNHPKHHLWVRDCAFSDDSQFLFTACSDNKARLWNATTGEIKREYEGHQKALTCLRFMDGVS